MPYAAADLSISSAMILTAITTPYFWEGEAEHLRQLLSSGEYTRVDIRKPFADTRSVERLIREIGQEFRHRLSLHSHFELAGEPAIGGIYLSRRNPYPPEGWKGAICCSCHSIDELSEMLPQVDYAYISPIFPSVSKPGYGIGSNMIDDSRLTRLLRSPHGSKIVALGGVTPARLPLLAEKGFSQAALLGSAMGVKEFPLESFRLQFITHGDTVENLINQTRTVLDGGCRWVQLRAKHFTPEMIVAAGKEISRLCHQAGAVMIIDDHTQLVIATGADGVHLGRNDMSVTEARHILGPKYIIGATANTATHIEEAYRAGADYIGLGPFRFTTTKTNLSPVLGEEGYREIRRHCLDRDIHIPVVAIGGITPHDIEGIISAGADGIAVSGTIIRSENPVGTTHQLKQLIDINIKHNTH